MTRIILRLPAFATRREALDWCERNGWKILVLEVGPDQTTRGIAEKETS